MASTPPQLHLADDVSPNQTGRPKQSDDFRHDILVIIRAVPDDETNRCRPERQPMGTYTRLFNEYIESTERMFFLTDLCLDKESLA